MSTPADHFAAFEADQRDKGNGMKIDVNVVVHLASTDEVRRIEQALATLKSIGDNIMATLQDVQAAIVAAKAAVATEATKVQSDIADLGKQVAALQAQLAAGGAVTAADLDGIVADLATISTGVGNIEVAAAPKPTP
jgi:hypothetical protein